ncbi:uncharacterized protein [Pagrus major]|uniref:uncharacterized protein n=1 Tax=Pagrus major TaxID=143350 RepID=UPI003CC86172
MSSEVCPFCGKTYKRLKTHLPHCKAAASSKTPPTKHDVTVNQTSSSRLVTPSTEPTAEETLSTQRLSVAAKKSKKMSSSPETPSQSADTSSSLSLSSESLPPSTKKKKQKLSKQIKTATIPPVPTQSHSPSLPPTISKPKKQSLRALIEAAKSKQVSATEDLPSGSAPFVTDPQTETKTNPDTDLVKDDAHPAFLSSDTKPKSASKIKATKMKKVAQTHSTTKDTSSSLDSKENQSSAKPRGRNDFLDDNKEEFDDLSVNKLFLKSGSAHQARITLQDVKATLGRAHSSRQSSILNQIRTTDDPRPGTGLRSQSQDADSCLVTTKSPSSSSSQHTELQSVKPKQTSLISLRHDGSPQSEPASPTSPHLLSQVSQAKFPPQTVSTTEGLKVAGLPTISPPLSQLSSPHLFPLAPQTSLPRVETLRADDGLMREKSQLGIRNHNTADHGSKGVLTQRSLGQVRLRELPEWLACKTPSHPRDVVEMVQRGWQWYYRRYINVKKGGVGGLGMLLAGYCVLSYTWSYPHIKHDRWRKHH